MALDLANLDQKLGRNPFLVERLDQLGHPLILLGLAAHIDLRSPLLRIELLKILPRDGRPLFQIGLGKIFDQAIELLLRLVTPADVHQETDHSLAFLDVFLLDPAEKMHHRRRAEPD